MVKTAVLSILAGLAFCGSAEAATKFSIAQDGVSCSGDFDVTSISVDCGDACTWGSSVKISGTVDIESGLSTETAGVTVKVANLVQILDTEVNVCRELSSSDGATCPEAGEYSFDGLKFDLPGDGDSWYSQTGWGSVNVKAVFDFDGDTTTCQTTVKLTKNNNSGYQMAGAAVFVVGLLACVSLKRRRTATIKLNEDEGTQSHFEMMPNDAGVQV